MHLIVYKLFSKTKKQQTNFSLCHLAFIFKTFSKIIKKHQTNHSVFYLELRVFIPRGYVGKIHLSFQIKKKNIFFFFHHINLFLSK